MTQAEALSKHGLITSILPIACEEIGQTQGQFSVNDLAQCMANVFCETRNSAAETEGFVTLRAAAKGAGSTAEILQWHLGGRLAETRLLHGIRRLDHRRFDIEVIRALAKERRGPDHNRITLVATMLGIEPDSVKRLFDNSIDCPRL